MKWSVFIKNKCVKICLCHSFVRTLHREKIIGRNVFLVRLQNYNDHSVGVIQNTYYLLMFKLEEI